MAKQTNASAKEAPQFQAPKKKKKWLKHIIALTVIVALLALFLTQCMKGGVQTASGSYLPATAAVQDLTVAVTGPGTVKPNDTYRATALVKGEVLSAPFEEGQEIHKDDTLFVIDASDVETAIQQAQLSVQSAQLNYDSLVRTRNDNTQDRQVKANASGVVTKVYVDPGDTVAAGTPIADILDRDNMKLKVPFHSVNATAFYVGQSATVTVSGTAETLYGTITEIAATDSVGAGGTLVRNVTIAVQNPGALSNTSMGSAMVGEVSSSASGTFQYGESKQLIAKYSGELQTLDLNEGDKVYDGQLLGEFKETKMQDQIDAAAIQLQNARLSLQNAKDRLEDYTITSPIDGTVIEKNYKAGDNIDPSTATATGANAFLAVIYDMSRLTFDINVSEMDVVRVEVGQKVTFTADALDGQEFTGVVEKVNINGTTQNGNTSYPVTVVVDGSGSDLASQGLLPGMSVSASIIVEEIADVLAIPVDAVQRSETPYVFVAGEGAMDDKGNLVDFTKLEQRTVELGRNSDEFIEILSGLEEGETVFIPNAASSIMSQMFM
ncbi:MAG: efflux RND transporter periplasmic adaptor subunit [Oscillospiraceae bacterium]|jgi:HlyD family secretion protein|nr:efflux RND transporter periplasmic adaptor subunit [Oscillospiraceae bacterium]